MFLHEQVKKIFENLLNVLLMVERIVKVKKCFHEVVAVIFAFVQAHLMNRYHLNGIKTAS